jgi:HAD superfamily hydrolase (TIGR01490 family)
MPDLALFDFDGTITVADTFTPFLRLAVTPARARVGKLVLAPVIASYKLGLMRPSAARAAVARVAFWKTRADDVRRLGERYATEQLARVVRPKALERVRWHKARGDTVVLVSASLDAYLSSWCAALGIDLICTTLENRGGTLTGRYLHGDCTGGEKARRIRERYDLAAYSTIFAYGDTLEDEAMLGLAHRRYFRWQEVDDVRAAAGRHRTGNPDHPERLGEIHHEDRHLARLVAGQR